MKNTRFRNQPTMNKKKVGMGFANVCLYFPTFIKWEKCNANTLDAACLLNAYRKCSGKGKEYKSIAKESRLFLLLTLDSFLCFCVT